MSIDEHVPEEIAAQFRSFANLRRRIPEMMIFRYEDMVEDFGSWMGEVTAYLGLDERPELTEGVVSSVTFTVAKEDPSSHQRSGKVGVYVNQLKPKTVSLLNERDGTTLKEYGY